MTATLSAAKTLDLRRTEPKDRHPLVFSTFDALTAKESFVLISDHAPKPLLYTFQAERKGLFEWSPLEEGPDVWQTEIARRQAAPGELRTVFESLEWDHDRLEAIEASAFAARSEGNLELASERFGTFAHGLARHIGFEEQILFPVFEERGGLSPQIGPTAVMRSEHIEIKALLESIGKGIGDASSPVDQLRAMLHRVLNDHNFKEEQIIYPSTDRFLRSEESDALVARIQAFCA